MALRIAFLERREGGSPSIERVFLAVSQDLGSRGVSCVFHKAPYGIDFFSTIRNLLFFRPPDSDIFHVTGHINYMGLVLPQAKTVLTIHDLTILDLRKGFRRWLIEHLYFVWPARRVRYLTAVSQATKDRLVDVAKIPPQKVRVIENPLLVPEADPRKFDPIEPTILQIGTAENKNLDRLIRALEGIPCLLRIVGPLPESSRKLLHSLRVNFVNDIALDDAQIREAYLNAEIVIFCSTNEGFGLPILEAQASGVALVTSDRSPMREVAGDGALVVDPERIDEISDAVRRLVNDRELRETLISKGRENVKRFNVRTIGSAYLALYAEVVANQKL